VDIFEHKQVEHNVELAINMIRNSGIVPDCYSIAQDFVSSACSALDSFSDGPCRRKLIEIADYVVRRSK
jgi:geranylgeranyl pyrophosphate synthase